MFYLKNSCAFTLSKKGKEVNMLKKTKNQIKNQNKGITLIALVITIVVLLILASISIAMLRRR